MQSQEQEKRQNCPTPSRYLLLPGVLSFMLLPPDKIVKDFLAEWWTVKTNPHHTHTLHTRHSLDGLLCRWLATDVRSLPEADVSLRAEMETGGGGSGGGPGLQFLFLESENRTETSAIICLSVIIFCPHQASRKLESKHHQRHTLEVFRIYWRPTMSLAPC